MFGLRALIFLVISLGAFDIQAVSQKFMMGYDYQSTRLTDSLKTQSQPSADMQTQTLGYQGQDLFSGFSFAGNLKVQQPDYSSYLIYDESGKSSSLSSGERQNEYFAETRADYAIGENSTFLSLFSNLNSSPFYTQGIQAGYSRGFFSQTTIAGIRMLYLRQKQPASYFKNFDFQDEMRKEQISGQEVAATFEQILNKEHKFQVEVSRSQRIGERPPHVGLKYKHGWAPTNHLFNQVQIYRLSEDTSQKLMNERGYFSSNGIDLLTTYEPIYDMYLSFSYGVSVERESDPRTNNEVQVGTDQFGFGLKYKTSYDITYSFQGAYALTNADKKNVLVSGGVEWVL